MYKIMKKICKKLQFKITVEKQLQQMIKVIKAFCGDIQSHKTYLHLPQIYKTRIERDFLKYTTNNIHIPDIPVRLHLVRPVDLL